MSAANPGFDPYGNGSWMLTPGYGYVCASGYPWGYMPYQCGTWNFYNGFGWGWAPGAGMGMGMGVGMGVGCHPWWGIGRYGGINIGRGPIGYRPIPRPIHRRTIAGNANPVIPVSRRLAGASGVLPARSRNTPAQIAGYTVQPLRPLQSRQSFQNTSPGSAYHPGQGNQGAAGGQAIGARTPYGGTSPGLNPPSPRTPGNQGFGGQTRPIPRALRLPTRPPAPTRLPAILPAAAAVAVIRPAAAVAAAIPPAAVAVAEAVVPMAVAAGVAGVAAAPTVVAAVVEAVVVTTSASR